MKARLVRERRSAGTVLFGNAARGATSYVIWGAVNMRFCIVSCLDRVTHRPLEGARRV